MFRPRKTKRTTGKKAYLPAGLVPSVAAGLKAIEARHRTLDLISAVWIVNDATRQPYLEDTFRRAVGGAELQFRHLRHTGFTRLVGAGALIEDGCIISTHSLKGGYAIVDRYDIRTIAGDGGDGPDTD
jgi:hypothetical protein